MLEHQDFPEMPDELVPQASDSRETPDNPDPLTESREHPELRVTVELQDETVCQEPREPRETEEHQAVEEIW